MNKKPPVSKDPDMVASFAALRRAAKRALRLGIEKGTPVYAMVDGKIVDLTRRRRRGKRSR
jgi:hypothetical protein